MSIHYNGVSNKANYALYTQNVKLDSVLEKLASGNRINGASDDAAGLQISDRLTAQRLGLNASIWSANSGISVVQSAESGLENIANNLQRIRELSIQAQNGIYTSQDITALNNEVGEYLQDIQNIADNTKLAGTNLLDGSYERDFVASSDGSQSITVSLLGDGFGLSGLGLGGFSVEEGASASLSGSDVSGAGALAAGDVLLTADSGVGDRSISVSTDDGLTFIERTLSLVGVDSANAALISNTINDALGQTATSANLLTGQVTLDSNVNGLRIATPAGPLQISSNLNSNIGSYSTASASTTGSPIQQIDDALTTVNEARARLGALQNRFDSTISSLNATSEDIAASNSKILDVNYANQASIRTRNSILRDASQSVLLIANQSPQTTLSLLANL